MLRADREEPGHVRRGVERRWENVFEGGLTDLSQESFEQKRLEADQRSASGGACDAWHAATGAALSSARARSG